MGKICTVLTSPDNFPHWFQEYFKNPKLYSEFFTGEVTGVSNDGITIKHLKTGTQAFYPFPIAGLIEEKVISSKDPNYEKIKEAIEEKKKTPAPPMSPKWKANDVVSIEEMTQMAKKLKAKKG